MVGGDYVPKELKCLAEDGRLVFIAYLRGPKTELNIDAVMRRRLTITGSTLRPRPVEFKAAIARSLREKIWPLIEAGQIKPEIYKTFPLEQAAEAHRLMESSQHIGKIVLTSLAFGASVFSHSRNAVTSGRRRHFRHDGEIGARRIGLDLKGATSSPSASGPSPAGFGRARRHGRRRRPG